MIRYSKFRPTSLDLQGLFCKDKQDWYVCGISVNRDSSVLARANWKALGKILNKYPGEFEVNSFGHWGCGWFEIVLIKPESELFRVVESIEKALTDYPVICDSTYSEMENEDILEIWASMSLSKRIELCKKSEANIFSSRNANRVPDGVWSEIRNTWL